MNSVKNEKLFDLNYGTYNIVNTPIMELKKSNIGQKKKIFIESAIVHVIPIVAIFMLLLVFIICFSDFYKVPIIKQKERDLREFLITFLMPYPGMVLIGMIGGMAIPYRKIRYYEKQLGKPIRNGIPRKDGKFEADDIVFKVETDKKGKHSLVHVDNPEELNEK